MHQRRDRELWSKLSHGFNAKCIPRREVVRPNITLYDYVIWRLFGSERSMDTLCLLLNDLLAWFFDNWTSYEQKIKMYTLYSRLYILMVHTFFVKGMLRVNRRSLPCRSTTWSQRKSQISSTSYSSNCVAFWLALVLKTNANQALRQLGLIRESFPSNSNQALSGRALHYCRPGLIRQISAPTPTRPYQAEFYKMGKSVIIHRVAYKHKTWGKKKAELYRHRKEALSDEAWVGYENLLQYIIDCLFICGAMQ